MSEKKVWFITGAGRGLGVDIAKAALAAGHAVVATARNAESVTKALGEHDDLLAVDLDVTDPAAAAGRRRTRPWSGSAGSTCWSTTPATSKPGSSRR